jgi:hemolysin activation/secretion protein
MASPAAAMLPLVVAQVLAPSVQPGPARLPADWPPPARNNVLPPRLPLPAPAPRPVEGQPSPDSPRQPVPRVEGLNLYSSAEIERLLQPCLRSLPSTPATPASPPVDPTLASEMTERLARCAALLSSRLVADGFINSRVYPREEPAPMGTLFVVEGRLVEVRVRGPNRALQRRLQRLVLPLQGQVLHLPSLERTLDHLARLPGVGGLSASLNRLGGDSTKAVLELEVAAAARPLVGEISLRNDGSGGSGQFRGLAVLSKTGTLLERDQLFLVGELNSDADPQLGYRALSFSYSLPLAERLAFTTAVATSWRQLVESPPPLDTLLFDQRQLLGQFDVTLHEGLRQRLSAFAGLSANRSTSWLDGEPFPAIAGGAEKGRLHSGFVQAGLNWEAAFPSLSLGARLYGLQGLAGFSGESALRELAMIGIEAGEARALGAELNLQWPLAPGWRLQARGAGQYASQPLLNTMGFSLGSDNGLRGLPGQVVSGDSGVLASGELSWAVWSRGQQELQLVPFLGAGRVRTTLRGVSESGSLGAGGVLLRWIQGRHWLLELGWATQFGDGLQATETNWLIDNGVYSKLSYRF